MDEDKNDNVWNASGVILDIDSGGLNEIYTFFVLQFCSFWPACHTLTQMMLPKHSFLGDENMLSIYDM